MPNLATSPYLIIQMGELSVLPNESGFQFSNGHREAMWSAMWFTAWARMKFHGPRVKTASTSAGACSRPANRRSHLESRVRSKTDENVVGPIHQQGVISESLRAKVNIEAGRN